MADGGQQGRGREKLPCEDRGMSHQNDCGKESGTSHRAGERAGQSLDADRVNHTFSTNNLGVSWASQTGKGVLGGGLKPLRSEKLGRRRWRRLQPRAGPLAGKWRLPSRSHGPFKALKRLAENSRNCYHGARFSEAVWIPSVVFPPVRKNICRS